VTDYLSRRVPAAIRVLWLLGDGDWHAALEVAPQAGITYPTAQTILGAARHFGFLECQEAPDGPQYRVCNWPRVEEALQPFRPYLDGSYFEALRQAKEEVRERIFGVPGTTSSGHPLGDHDP